MEPYRRVGVAHVAEQERSVFEREQFLHSRDLWGRDLRFILAIQVEAPDLRWASKQIGNIKRICARHDLLDHRFPGSNNLRGIFQFRHIERQTKNLSVRRLRARKQIKRAIAPEARKFYLIAKLRDLLPRSIWPKQIMREVTAIAVRYSRKNVFAVAGTCERYLCDSWEVFANRIRVLCVGRAELMKVNLLIKIQISIRPLAFSGKPCVINPGAIRVPS